jgi:hypothetical protein
MTKQSATPAARRSPVGGAWLALATSSLLCVGALELALRWFAPLPASPYQPDDQLLVTLVPGAKKVFRRPSGQRITSQVNSDGFRGEEIEADHGQRRIIVYGDSNVAAEFSELDATFAVQLERALAPHGVEIINAGVVGYGPDQVSLAMPADIARLAPSLVLVVVFADNDFGDLLRNRIYRAEPGEPLLNNYRLSPTMRAELAAGAFPRGLRRLQVRRYGGRLWAMVRDRWAEGGTTSSYVETYIESSRERTAASFAGYLAENPGDRIAEHPFHDYYDADIAMLPQLASAKLKIDLMEKVLLRLRALAAQSATPLALLILPSAIDVCEHYDMRVDTARYPQYERERLSGTVEALAARAQIAHLNLYQPMRASNACAFYFDGGDGHWNDAGQAFAARLVAQFIEDQRLLPPR